MRKLPVLTLLCIAGCFGTAWAHRDDSSSAVDVRMRLVYPRQGSNSPAPAVLWLKPLQADPPAFPPHGRYTLLQKNRMFTPHLLVVPVGSVVSFPNADPFFHNVFSLFDGKRFDLGLYEAGSTKAVTFSREGVSYIFCNIHPEMSAVVVALVTPLYSIATAEGSFQIRDVPVGNYELHAWVEGVPQAVLDGLTRRVRIDAGSGQLGVLNVVATPIRNDSHLNKFGQSYDREPRTTY